MISRGEQPATDWVGQPLDNDPRCGGCGRSLISRFGSPIVNAECPSCEDEFKRLAKAGKITEEDGTPLEFFFPEQEKGEAS